MNYIKDKHKRRIRRHKGIRKKISGLAERPRLTVFRSLKNIYCQLIDDSTGRTLAYVSTLSKDIRESISYGGNVKAAELVGKRIAEEAKKHGITKIVFDRSGYKYHGRIKALADSARENDLVF